MERTTHLLWVVGLSLFCCLASISTSIADEKQSKPAKRVGKIRLFRLKHSGAWNRGVEQKCDTNLLVEYGLRTSMLTSADSEPISALELEKFRNDSAPPIVLVDGDDGCTLNDRQIVAVRGYLAASRGLFVVNAGTKKMYSDAKAMMRAVFPTASPVLVPADDFIMRQPYQIQSIPVSGYPHSREKGQKLGASMLLGWKVKGRWVAIATQGDWTSILRDGEKGKHDTVRRELAFRVGVNLIFNSYANAARIKVGMPKSSKTPPDIESLLDLD